MPKLTKSVPKYRHHKATGQAVVTIQGRDHYLGPWRSTASKLEYDRLIGEWLAAGRPQAASKTECDITVAELLAAYCKFARSYYVKNGEPTGTIPGIKVALRILRQSYGHTRAIDFGPLALKSLQGKMFESEHSRRYINDNVDRIRRAFKWAVAEELIPASVYQSLTTVPGLRKGRTAAREPEPIEPVDDATVEATLPHLPDVVADMVRFQRLTGCRPAEVRLLRPCDVDTSDEVWCYRPSSHKTEHHGRDRIIFIGPQAQAVLRPYLLRDQSSCCFSPADSERKRRTQQHAERITPASCGNRPGTNRKRKPNRTAGVMYTKDSYRQAIQRACEKAGVECWAPNRLRHSAATKIRKMFGVEAAQVVLGHSRADVTQVYAERDLAKAEDIMREVG